MYANWTSKTCESLGFKYDLIEVNKNDLETALIKANKDDEVNGIMVYFPVFGDKQDQYLQQLISPEKDVEGLNFYIIITCIIMLDSWILLIINKNLSYHVLH